MSGAGYIRPATHADIMAILAMADISPGAPHWTEAQFLEVLEKAQCKAGNRIVLLAELDGPLQGFIVLSAFESQAELESVVVAADFRRQGIGAALCHAAFEWAQRRGAREVWLEVRASNAAARRLYASLGFAEAGLRRSYYRDPDEDAVVMQCILTTATHI